MNYLKIENGTPTQVSLRELSNELRKAGKSPVAWWQIVDETRRNEILARYDVFPFTEEVRPTYNPDIQKLVRTPFVQDAQGNWSRGWDVVTATGNPGFEEEAKRQQFRLGVSQILTKNLLMDLSFETITDEGYLNNPYRSVRYLVNPTTYASEGEQYPNTRTSHAVAPATQG